MLYVVSKYRELKIERNNVRGKYLGGALTDKNAWEGIDIH